MPARPAVDHRLELLAELPDAHEPLVPSASSTALTNPMRELRLAGWRGGMAAGLPALAVTLVLRDIVNFVIPGVLGALSSVAPHFLIPYAGIGTAALLPALLAIPIGLLAARAVSQLGERDPDLARAAAAGAGMGAAAVSAGALALELARTGDLFPIPFLATAAALGVGVVGTMAFAAVPRGRRKGPTVPSLYLGLTAAGLGGPALLLGGALWAGVASLLPFLSPWSLTPGFLSSGVAGATAATIAMVGLAPVSYLSARSMQRTFPRGSPAALGLGLAIPPAVPFLAVLSAVFFEFPHMLDAAGATLVGGALAFVVHACAIALGLARAREGQTTTRQITD